MPCRHYIAGLALATSPPDCSPCTARSRSRPRIRTRPATRSPRPKPPTDILATVKEWNSDKFAVSADRVPQGKRHAAQARREGDRSDRRTASPSSCPAAPRSRRRASTRQALRQRRLPQQGVLLLRRPDRQAGLGRGPGRRRPDLGRLPGRRHHLQHRILHHLRAGRRHRQTALVAVPGRPADQHADHRQRQGLHRLSRPGRRPAARRGQGRRRRARTSWPPST